MKKALTALCVAVGLLLIADGLVLQDGLHDLSRLYYSHLEEASGLVGRGQAGTQPGYGLIRRMEEIVFAPGGHSGPRPGPGGPPPTEANRPVGGSTVEMGPCDAVLVHELAAAGGFLCYLALYFSAVALVWAILQGLPPSWRRPGLLAGSLGFLATALPALPATWFLIFGLQAWALAITPIPRRLRAVLLPLLLAAFLLVLGKEIVALCLGGSFHISQIHPNSHDTLLSADWFRHLAGLLNVPPPARDIDFGERFPYLLPALGLLITLPRRIAWLSWELWVGETDRPDPLDCLLYLLGLPFLIGNAASPSFADFSGNFEKGPRAGTGGPTVLTCLGLGALGYVALVGLGSSPAVRLLFFPCDLELASPAWVWLRLIVAYVAGYLYLQATEQLSVGVCRLFGYGVPDNYVAPLQARNVADFWRRWNVLWRNFLVRVFFLPTALALGRRRGRSETWHLVVATAVTFLGTFALNVLPLLLLTRFETATVWSSGQAASALAEEAPLALNQLLPALALYYALEGVIVAWNLCFEARNSPPRLRLPRAAAVALTFLFIAAARVLVTPGTMFQDKLDLLARAFGF